MLKLSGADSIVTLSIHSNDLCIYSDIAIINLDSETLLMNAILEESIRKESLVIIAPDAGSSNRCKENIQKFHCDSALIHKGIHYNVLAL